MNFIDKVNSLKIGRYLVVQGTDWESYIDGELIEIGDDYVLLRSLNGNESIVKLVEVAAIVITKEHFERSKKRFEMDEKQRDIEERKYEETLPFSTTNKRQPWER